MSFLFCPLWCWFRQGPNNRKANYVFFNWCPYDKLTKSIFWLFRKTNLFFCYFSIWGIICSWHTIIIRYWSEEGLQAGATERDETKAKERICVSKLILLSFIFSNENQCFNFLEKVWQSFGHLEFSLLFEFSLFDRRHNLKLLHQRENKLVLVLWRAGSDCEACHALQCHAMPCHATPCQAMLCHPLPSLAMASSHKKSVLRKIVDLFWADRIGSFRQLTCNGQLDVLNLS